MTTHLLDECFIDCWRGRGHGSALIDLISKGMKRTRIVLMFVGAGCERVVWVINLCVCVRKLYQAALYLFSRERETAWRGVQYLAT